MTAIVGVVTGLAAEAALLRAAGITALVRCGGSSTERARIAARQLVAEGATALLSFGVAGSLVSIAQPGQIVLAEEVVLPDGRRLACCGRWHASLRERLAGLPVKLHGGALAGMDDPVCEPAAKHALRQHTGAMAVDMESHAVAEAAYAAAVPFLALRAIADPVDQSVPRFAMSGVDSDGNPHILPVLAGLLRQPWALPDLLRLGRHFEIALTSLRRAAALASPDPGWHTGEHAN